MAQINKPDEYFNTVLYTGNGTTGHAITGVGFQPDWLWIKERSSTSAAFIYDIIRGVDIKLTPSTTDGDATNSDSMSSFDSDGFTVGVNNAVNENTQTYVAWNWLASNTTASNTDGSITSTVSANTTSGFSIVSYTGTGANATIGHGLGVSPSMVIIKRTDSANDWRVGSDGLTNWTKYINLNTTSAESDLAVAFNSTAPTSSVFSVGTSPSTNASGGTFIAYCFASIKGYSKIGGSYTGNGSTDGSFCYLGMKPKFIMIKRTDSTGDWVIYDGVKEPYNVIDTYLEANSSNADTTLAVRELDILSNGFKVRGTNTAINASGSTYIYMAFAESPLVGTNNTPATAR